MSLKETNLKFKIKKRNKKKKQKSIVCFVAGSSSVVFVPGSLCDLLSQKEEEKKENRFVFFVDFFCAVCDVCLWLNNMVVASYGQCPRCHERRTAKANALKFLCLLEYEGKVIFFRPVVHITLL